MITYQINEIFYSLQGEGAHTGMPAVFIRLAGCSMGCWFCDTDHSTKMELAPTEIINEAEHLTKDCKTVVLTGGEPTEQDLYDLVQALKTKNYTIHLETNGEGTYRIPPGIDWITVSPKTLYVPSKIKRIADEAKFLYPTTFPLSYMLEFDMTKYIQPIHGYSYTRNLDDAITFCLNNPTFRLSLQTHKLIGVR